MREFGDEIRGSEDPSQTTPWSDHLERRKWSEMLRKTRKSEGAYFGEGAEFDNASVGVERGHCGRRRRRVGCIGGRIVETERSTEAE